MEMYTFYSEQVQACDEEIERMYSLIRPDWGDGEVQPLSECKQNSHSKNKPQNAEHIRQHLKRISGVDLSVVDGFGVSLAQTVIMEVGTDMSRRVELVETKFPSEKHFCAWLGLAPKHEISGGKVLKNLEDQEPRRTSLSDGGTFGEAGGLCFRGDVSADALQVGACASVRSHSARACAGGLAHAEGQS